ncbi:MAG: hypothetical protein GX058_07610 [Firmicutes bacterium]|nr:hypothetical protein [Bacillota bacterium]
MLSTHGLLFFLIIAVPLVVVSFVNTLDWIMARKRKLAFDSLAVTKESVQAMGVSYLVFGLTVALEIFLLTAAFGAVL